jgi:hypothetical protein
LPEDASAPESEALNPIFIGSAACACGAQKTNTAIKTAKIHVSGLNSRNINSMASSRR